MNERDELAHVIRGVDGPATLGGEELAEAILAAGYRKHPKVERDELRGTLSNTICNASNYPPKAVPYLLGGDMSEVLDRTAGAILAAGYRKPRIITTVEELDALANGSVIRTAGADEYEPRVVVKLSNWNGSAEWDVADCEELSVMTGELDDLPATVLWEPR